MLADIRVAAEVPIDVDVVGVPTDAAAAKGHPAAAFLTATGFSGATGETALLPGDPIQLLVGWESNLDRADLRRAVAAFARAASRFEKAALWVPETASPRIVTEAALLALYSYTRYKTSGDEPALTRLDLITTQPEAKAAVDEAKLIAGAVAFARDLVNEPGGSLTPSAFAERAALVAAEAGLACEVWDEQRIAAENLGGLLGVARGSTQPPRLVRLAYTPSGAERTIALVGKGITFDSGGLTLKPNNMMVDMKLDMAGAAAVLGAMSALRDLSCPTGVVAWLPLTDNMSGGDATRLGDVLRTRNGKTIEVRNADAEGRLILADALALAAEEHPDSIVDVATLTDTVPMAVGRRYGGLSGNDDAWLAEVRSAAEHAGELVWPLPLDGVDRKQLDSKIADMVNAPANRYGQSAVAALFLKEFVPSTIPWAHLDIAGAAFSDEEDGEITPGGTGYGVRTLIELVVRG